MKQDSEDLRYAVGRFAIAVRWALCSHDNPDNAAGLIRYGEELLARVRHEDAALRDLITSCLRSLRE